MNGNTSRQAIEKRSLSVSELRCASHSHPATPTRTPGTTVGAGGRDKIKLLTLALVLIASCADDSINDTVDIALTDLSCEALETTGLWASHPLPPADAPCTWLAFDGASTYIIEHGLGAAPTLVVGYIAFEESGVGATIASGDAFSIRDADATTVTVRNGTQQDFFLRLVLQ